MKTADLTKRLNIVVNEKNLGRLQSELDRVQARCSARTITAGDVQQIISAIEARLAIPRKYLDGVTASVDYNAQSFPGSYKYIPESTWVDLQRSAGTWKVTRIYRYKTAGAAEAFRLQLTEAACIEILKHMSTFGKVDMWEVLKD